MLQRPSLADSLERKQLIFQLASMGEISRETGYDALDVVMAVDFWGVVNGTKELLPHLIASGDGHLVNISSLFGLMSVPGQSAYNAAKFAVRGLTEALRQEMLALVQEVCQRQQLTMLMVSHSIEDAARIAPRSVVIAEGRIVWDGETEELMSGKASASHLLGILNG